jgi:putative glycosyltransferase (TIGR04348 family)
MICPAEPGSRLGNRRTALRWAAMLRALGHRVRIAQEYHGQACDLLIALHALKSAPAVAVSKRDFPHRPVIVALTGTDLYRDLPLSIAAQQTLDLATAIIVLQPRALDQVPARHRDKVRVILQSAVPVHHPEPRDHDHFDICVLAHLREEKDPFRAAQASLLLPSQSRIRILHAGRALSSEYGELARKQESLNPRYHWLGELSRRAANLLLARSRALALTSKLEGGANVISEAIVNGVPVIASRIDGSMGMLGRDYAGFFNVEDNTELAKLMLRLETDLTFCTELKNACDALRPLFDPARELTSWRELILVK